MFYDPQHVSSQTHGSVTLSGSPPGKGNSPTLATLLPIGKGNLGSIKSTVRTFIQNDLGVPWGGFGSNCVKVLLAEAILELYGCSPRGEKAALWWIWSNNRSEKGAIISEHHTVRKGKCIAQCVNQNSESRQSFFFYFSLFFQFFWRTGFTHFSWNRLLLVSRQSFVMEMRRYLFLTTRHKIHGKEKCFICM